MTVTEAKAAVNSKYPKLTAIGCMEYDSRFVFDMRPKGKADAGKVMDMLIEVNKSTGAVASFQPFRMPVDEYKKGRRINL